MTRSEAGRLGALKANQLWRKRYYNAPKACRCCGKQLLYEKRKNKFCNHSCAATYNNVGSSHNLRHGQYRMKPCLHCGITTEGKFCSRACSHRYQWQQTKREIEVSGSAKFKHTAKRYLVETHGNRCSECGIIDWQGKELVMIMDHINGNPYDWSLANLRLICPNCDSQTTATRKPQPIKGEMLEADAMQDERGIAQERVTKWPYPSCTRRLQAGRLSRQRAASLASSLPSMRA